MRDITAVAGALLFGWAGAGIAQAEEIAAPQTTPARLVASCDAPVANPNARPKRHVRRIVRRYRAPVRLVRVLPPPPPLVVYNPWLPSTYNGAYDRVMVQHFQAPPVSGVYGLDSEMPPTPPAAPFLPYRMQARGAVVQYDGITGEYIPLSQRDAQRVLAAAPLPILKEDE
jgi:hypothetical protein